MGRLFHVTSSRNRASIEVHGLDWNRMGAAPGIAGSSRPEAEGIFVCASEFDAGFFVGINNTGGPVDVWAIDGVDEELVETGAGFSYIPHAIPRQALTLIQLDVPPSPPERPAPGGTALATELTIAFDRPRAPKPGERGDW